eukprot:TRINITY_DN65_c0_g1_i2.p1 TRINITY_DN65_c0_g1~~TRINITY_DN65_c0_g1_i2.p1  ORF type:complete len:203 (-),score=48.53 TRINITY_DN65_c0_g1_i2:113-634(-)
MAYPPPYGSGYPPAGYPPAGYPPAYGAPPPMMGAPMMGAPMMGAPMMGAPMMGAPMMGGGSYMMQRPYGTFYARPPTYIYGQPFVIPAYIPPHLHARMYQASQAFRMFDYNMSGTLSKKEWKRALAHLGYFVPKGTAKMMFYQLDQNRSGQIDEWEFVNWWAGFNPAAAVGFY